MNLCEKNELATIKFLKSLPKGGGRLYISYKGVINDHLKGFYRSKYIDSTGATQYAGLTQFEVVNENI